jgi:hypothetical protein
MGTTKVRFENDSEPSYVNVGEIYLPGDWASASQKDAAWNVAYIRTLHTPYEA